MAGSKSKSTPNLDQAISTVLDYLKGPENCALNVIRLDLAIVLHGDNKGRVVQVRSFLGDKSRWLDHVYFPGEGPYWLVLSKSGYFNVKARSAYDVDAWETVTTALFPMPDSYLRRIVSGSLMRDLER